MAIIDSISPKITLYTNHGCPFAHRAHVVTKELGLEYEQVIIDLTKPREPWYLEINPRGLVPAMDFNGHIITESAIVCQFLADAYPSHLLPPTDSMENALKRARINFFTDTWTTKVGMFWMKIAMEDSEKEQERLADELVNTVKQEINPLLGDAAPFFGGSSKLTFAEALVAPMIIRLYVFANNGLLPKSIIDGLDGLGNFSKWAAEVVKQESVTYIWDEDRIVQQTRTRLAQSKVKVAC